MLSRRGLGTVGVVQIFGDWAGVSSKVLGGKSFSNFLRQKVGR